jgi:UbiD family decarboxylase
MAERFGPALLFDNIKGYAQGFRVSTNLMHHEIGQKLAFGFPEEMSKLECVANWKEKLSKFEPIAPVQVKDGPIKENVLKGEDIDIYKFPAPKWHTLDGGRYIGTGVITVTRDPDEGWVNFGTYRVMIQDKTTLAFYASPGKHATITREKYWAMGKPCPVAMCFRQDPLLFDLSTISLPWGISEYDMAGYLIRIVARKAPLVSGRAIMPREQERNLSFTSRSYITGTTPLFSASRQSSRRSTRGFLFQSIRPPFYVLSWKKPA